MYLRYTAELLFFLTHFPQACCIFYAADVQCFRVYFVFPYNFILFPFCNRVVYERNAWQFFFPLFFSAYFPIRISQDYDMIPRNITEYNAYNAFTCENN